MHFCSNGLVLLVALLFVVHQVGSQDATEVSVSTTTERMTTVSPRILDIAMFLQNAKDFGGENGDKLKATIKKLLPAFWNVISNEAAIRAALVVRDGGTAVPVKRIGFDNSLDPYFNTTYIKKDQNIALAITVYVSGFEKAETVLTASPAAHKAIVLIVDSRNYVNPPDNVTMDQLKDLQKKTTSDIPVFVVMFACAPGSKGTFDTSCGKTQLSPEDFHGIANPSDVFQPIPNVDTTQLANELLDHIMFSFGLTRPPPTTHPTTTTALTTTKEEPPPSEAPLPPTKRAGTAAPVASDSDGWVLPLVITLVVILVIAVSIGLLIAFLRYRKKKANGNEKEAGGPQAKVKKVEKPEEKQQRKAEMHRLDGRQEELAIQLNEQRELLKAPEATDQQKAEINGVRNKGSTNKAKQPKKN